MIRGIVFDLDDTLFDHVGAARAGLAAWSAGLGPAALTPDEIETLWFTLEERHHQRYVAGQVSLVGQRRARASEFLTGLGLPYDDTAHLDTLYDDFLAAYTRCWRPYPDARPALDRARSAGLEVCVLTNGDEQQQTAKVRAIGLADVCGPVLASSALPAGKPSPLAFSAACAAMALPLDSVLMVGDNLDLDIRGARAAGLHAVHLDRSGGGERGSIRSLAELSW